VVGTGPARTDQLAAEGVPGPEYPYGGVARADPRLDGEVLDRHAVQLDPPKGLTVLRLECLRQNRDATAEGPIGVVVRFVGSLELSGERLQCPAGRAPPPIVVDNGVAEDPVKPWDQCLILALRRPTEAPDEGVLEQVLGGVAIPDPTFQVAQESLVVGHQALDDRLGGR